MPKMTKKQEWHDKILDIALEMGRSRHIGKRRALYAAGTWLHRAGDRMKDGRNIYTSEPLGSHASLECPECDRLCKPHKQRPDGSCTYVCTNRNGHANFECLTFTIDADGDLYF